MSEMPAIDDEIMDNISDYVNTALNAVEDIIGYNIGKLDSFLKEHKKYNAKARLLIETISLCLIFEKIAEEKSRIISRIMYLSEEEDEEEYYIDEEFDDDEDVVEVDKVDTEQDKNAQHDRDENKKDNEDNDEDLESPDKYMRGLIFGLISKALDFVSNLFVESDEEGIITEEEIIRTKIMLSAWLSSEIKNRKDDDLLLEFAFGPKEDVDILEDINIDISSE